MQENEETVSKFFDSILYKQMNIMVKGKFEFYNGENRMRFFAVKVFPIATQNENKALLRRLNIYEGKKTNPA